MLISIQKMIDPLWSAVNRAGHRFFSSKFNDVIGPAGSFGGTATKINKAPLGRHIPTLKRRRRYALP
jgi:hypothetical protein